MKNENQYENTINIDCSDRSHNERFLSPNNGSVIQKADKIINVFGNSPSGASKNLLDHCEVKQKGRTGLVLFPQILAFVTEVITFWNKIADFFQVPEGSSALEVIWERCTSISLYGAEHMGIMLLIFVTGVTVYTLTRTIRVLIDKRLNVHIWRGNGNEYKRIIVHNKGNFFVIRPKRCWCGGRTQIIRSNGRDYVVCKLTGSHSTEVDITESIKE